MTLATRIASVAGSIALAAGLGLTGAATANADGPRMGEGEVSAKGGLSMRYAPSIYSKRVGALRDGDKITLVCKVRGTNVGGNDIWYSVPVVKTQWVSARYVDNIGRTPDWCTDSDAKGKNSQAIALNLRAGPTTEDRVVGSLPANGKVELICRAKGESVRGNKLWYQTSDRKWVTARYVDNVGKAPGLC